MNFRARLGLCLLAAAVCLFLLANRAAYRGYFYDDDLDALAWIRLLPLSDYLWGLVTPRFQVHNFRPLSQLCVFTAHRLFGLDYPGYVAGLHLIHLANIVLLWLLSRRMGAGMIAASAGTLFFAFHMALFDVYWKPMYIYDALCTTCVLACVLAYSHRRWIVAFAFFWLAYKAKELAVVVPVILLAWEFWLGERRYLRLVPFFAVSLSFGLQAIIRNPNRDNDYTFRFTLDALLHTVPYYASRIFLLPWAGLLLLLLPFVSRDRRVWFGLAWAVVVFAPLVFLPGRVFSAYCYLPIAGLALAFAAIVSADWIAPGLCAAALWIAWNLPILRAERRTALSQMDVNRQFAETILRSTDRLSRVHTVVYDSLPAHFHIWGLTGTLQYAKPGTQIQVAELAQRSPADALRDPGVALLQWNDETRKLHVLFRESDLPDSPYLAMNADTPIWQLGEGWFGLESTFRWIQPRATAYLRRPPSTGRFKLEVNAGEELLRRGGSVAVEISIDGTFAGRASFDRPGISQADFDLPQQLQTPADRCLVELRVTPGIQAGERRLGIAIRGLGFLESRVEGK